MSSIRQFLILIAINVFVLCALLGAVVFLPSVAYDLYRLAQSSTSLGLDPRGNLPNYRNSDWPKKHFTESASLKIEYFDFIVWRRKAFSGSTITIDENGYRRHSISSENDFNSSKIWFFGGSTTWGDGVRDSETIPAMVQEISGKTTFNFGETAYVAQQSLNLLMKSYIQGGKPDFVFFYDGVNEVAHKCRAGQNFFSSAEENKIRSKVQGNSIFSGQFEHSSSVFNSTIHVIQKLIHKIGFQGQDSKEASLYDCHENPRKSALIAKTLVDNWQIAKAIVESNGGSFIPVLQPVAYIGHPKMNHLPEVGRDKTLQRQYAVIYEEVRVLAKKVNLYYLDLTDLFNRDEYIYIDFCHISPNGNQLVAKRLSKLIE